jgi:hypothetical protein
MLTPVAGGECHHLHAHSDEVGRGFRAKVASVFPAGSLASAMCRSMPGGHSLV